MKKYIALQPVLTKDGRVEPGGVLSLPAKEIARLVADGYAAEETVVQTAEQLKALADADAKVKADADAKAKADADAKAKADADAKAKADADAKAKTDNANRQQANS